MPPDFGNNAILAGCLPPLTPWADRLRPHQLEAVEQALKAFADGDRATQVLSCGTGKTRIGAVVAATLAPTGLRLVLAPTVMLLAQLLREYRLTLGDAALGTILVICSAHDAAERAGVEELQALHVRVTTDPIVIAATASRPGPVTMLSTYASVATLSRAHHEHAMPPVDILIADEAHRTVSGTQWRRVHDDTHLPARKRLYMTATPRKLVGARRDADVVGMDDETMYGPTVYRLGYGTARDLGLAVPYRLVVSLVSDAQIRAITDQTHGRAAMHVRGKKIAVRMLAAQIAILRAAATYGVGRAITFHTTNNDAQHFATTLPEVAGLVAADARPTTLWADHIRYEHSTAVRRQRLQRLAEGAAGGLAVLSSARMLSEGVDMPAVDAVLFADPRRSTVDIVQAIGRALRPGGRPDKVATIIVPLLADPGADLAAALDSSDYASVWEVVRALRSHDDEVAADVDQRRRERGRGDNRPRPIRWLTIDGDADAPRAFAEQIMVGIVEAATASWEEYYGAACAYAVAHGDLLIPEEWVSPAGLRVGKWLIAQRAQRTRGQLRPERITLLDAIGMAWSVREADWKRQYAALTAYHCEHGHADVPYAYVTADGFRLGVWASRLRGGRKALTAKQRAQLDMLGVKINDGPGAWERHHAAAAAFHREHGHLRVPVAYVTPDGIRLGPWIRQMRAKGDRLPRWERQRLDALNMIWKPRQEAAKAHQADWEAAVAAATAYVNEHGHLRPLTRYVTSDGYPLGRRLSRWRSPFFSRPLTAQQRAVLDALDPNWAQPSLQSSSSTRQAPEVAHHRRRSS
ncbi:DEAD/DEAH box helicase [Nonomuraea turkmeniaca]|nr:DEAD/DEAH box helicase [Nonomuraea turkmeniaca]